MTDERIQSECRLSESDMIQVPERPRELLHILQQLTELKVRVEKLETSSQS